MSLHKVSKLRFYRALSAVLPHVSTDETREQLCHVLIESTKGRLTMVATMGHSMAIASLESEAPHHKDRSFLLPLEQAAALAKAIRPRNKAAQADPVTITIAAQGYLAISCDGEERRFSAPPATLEFPPYRSVVPQAAMGHSEEQAAAAPTAISPTNLRRLADSASAWFYKADPEWPLRQSAVTDPLDPIRFDSDQPPGNLHDDRLIVVVMPMR